MTKIVIFMQNRNFFGAQIVHIPFLKLLRKKFPESKITLFSKVSMSQLLVDLGFADELIIEKSKKNTLQKYIDIKPDISINLRKQSLFINALLSFCTFKKKYGYTTFVTKLFFTHTIPYDTKVYRAQNYLNLFNEELNYEPTAFSQDILIIPGAGDAYKVWNLESYIEVASYLQKSYPLCKVIFVLGEKEKDFLPQLEGRFEIYFNLEITTLYTKISQAFFVLANDCGPSHIAQINGVKNLILFSDAFGSAHETIKEWFNPSPIKKYLIGKPHESINSIKVQDVNETIESLIK